jgi:hypothetical protein
MSGAAGAQYRCDSCGRDLSGFSLGVPCLCGSTRRRRIDAVDAVFRRPAAAESPGWDPFKDWTVKYLQFSWNVTQLRRLYEPGSGAEALEVRRIVEATLTSCWNLAEWLSSGPEPVTITPGEIARFIKTEPVSVCTAFAAADSTGAATARIVPVGFASQPQFWVEYRQPGQRSVRYDALDLAERCLVAWRMFLKERKVALPTWKS